MHREEFLQCDGKHRLTIEMSDGRFFKLSFVFLLALSFTVIMLAFTIFHYAYLVSGNRTTLEFCDSDHKQHKPNYDDGCWTNWVSVFGTNPLFWFFPICKNR